MADLISVIVPVYNVAEDLPRCLNSILAQTYPNMEIIAVDDGSSDSSGDILDGYGMKNSRIRVIHKENGGVTSARLCGVKEACGNWIGFVDSDDEIEPDMFERLLINAQKYHAEISHCGYQMVFDDGRVHYFHNTGHLETQDTTTALRALLSGEMIEPGLWNKLYHRRLFNSLFCSNVMALDITINEDLLMNFFLFSEAQTSVFEDWCPYHYIVRNLSATRSKMNQHRIYDPIRVKEIIRRKVTDDLSLDAQRAYLNTCISVYHSLMFVGKEYQDDLKKVRAFLQQEKYSFPILGKKRALMAHLIIHSPIMYKPIYGFYCRFLQKNVYF